MATQQRFSIRALELLLSVCFTFTCCDAAEIGIFALMGSPSHRNLYFPIAEALIVRGHNVKMYTLNPPTNTIPGLLEIVIPNLIPSHMQYFPGTLKTDKPLVFQQTCRDILHSKEILELLNQTRKVFDVGISDGVVQDCLLPLVDKVSISTIYSITSNIHTELLWIFNAPVPYSYIPDIYNSDLTPKMNFLQRTKNVIFCLYSLMFYDTSFIGHGERTQALIPATWPSVMEAFNKVSIVFVNQHPSTDYVIPSLPFMRFIGGLHIEQPGTTPLGKDLGEFLDGSGNSGFILVSFGSFVPEEKIPEGAKQALIEAFSRIPQRVVWKYQGKLSPLSANVKVIDWVPQQSVLAHPKIKAFVTQGGQFSYQEAVYHGVPLIGIPVFADQDYNINRAVYFGFGAKLSWTEVTSEAVVQTIQTVVNDTSYKSRVVERSRLFRDNAIPPLDEAVYWIEYLVRHPGTLHLRPDLTHLNLAQYWLLDVIGSILFIIFLAVFIVYKVIRLGIRLYLKKIALSSDKKKK